MKRLSGGGRGETSPRTSVQTYCKPCELEIIDSAARAKGWTRSRFLLEAALVYAREAGEGAGAPSIPAETFSVRLCNGSAGGDFDSLEEALESARVDLGWDEIYTGEWDDYGNEDSGYHEGAHVYPSAEMASADSEGSPDHGAPTIRRIPASQ